MHCIATEHHNMMEVKAVGQRSAFHCAVHERTWQRTLHALQVKEEDDGRQRSDTQTQCQVAMSACCACWKSTLGQQL